jgi:iron(III) transport system ATP-binding protein
MSAPAIRVAEVSKTLGTHRALTNVSLEVADGDAVVVLGPSGSGKTTLIRIIAGLDTPDTGDVLIHGVQVARAGRTLVPPHQRGLGFVFQDLALWPHMNVEDHLSFVLAAQGVPTRERESRIRETLHLVHIEPLGARFPHELSGGEQQRAAIARAIVSLPRLLLLDEPLSSLDPELRVVLRAELARLRAELRMTMVYVSHDRDDAAALATRVIEMRAGRLEA